MSHRRRTQKKLSPSQFIKGLIIRIGLARKVKERGGKVAFRLLWGRIAAALASLMLIGWLTLAAAAWLFVKYERDFPEVRYVDLVFPHRWKIYRVARGDYYIAQSKKNLEAGDTANVLHLLRVGVQQSPDNTEGRLMLAGIYNVIGRPELGIDLLKSRVDNHADNKEYLSSLISLLFANHEDTAVDELATRLLGDDREPTERNLVLALAAATANFNRGNYARAEEFIERFNLLKSRSGTILQARIDWETGNSDSALRLMERVAQSGGELQDQALNFLVEYLWISGNRDRALQAAMLSFISDPLNFAPRLRLLSIYDLMEDDAKLQEETETFLELFGEEEPALQALASFAGRTGDSKLAERVYQRIRSHAMPSETAALAVIEARVVSGNYQGALNFSRQIENDTKDWTPLRLAQLQPLLAAANAGIGNTETTDILLQNVLASGNIAPAEMMKFAQRLIEIGDFVRAREVLQHIHTTQPLNQEALGRLIRLDIETGNNRNIVENVNRLLKTRKPPAIVLQEVRRHVSSDVFLFEHGRRELLTSIESALATALTVQGS